mgnify:CR=1 FL=1
MGYALAGLATGTNAGIQSTIIYLTIYLVMNLGAFCCIFMLKRENVFYENINDLSLIFMSCNESHRSYTLSKPVFNVSPVLNTAA